MSFLNRIQSQSAERSPNKTSIMGDKKRAEKLAAVIAALAVWQVFAMILGNSLLVAAPLDVAGRLFNLCISMEFWRIVGFSFVRIVYGFILALAAGIVFAILASRFRIVETMLFPYMLAVKSTPVASFIVLCLIWLSSKSLSVFIAFLIVLPIVYTNALHGIRDTDQKLLEMADLFRVRWWRKLYYIYIPQLKPYLLSACSVSIGMSWKAGIAAEVIGIPEGSIGEKLYEAKVYFSSVDLFAWTVAIIVLSILSEKLFIYILKSFLKPR